ncbi:MAG: peptidylprolyl isomerase [Candidatus Diapherotrites archaeon]
MEKGSIIRLSLTGRDLVTGRVFETTDEKTAKDAGIYRENASFQPITAVVGKGELIVGVDEALEQMSEGEEKTVRIPAEKAFGERKKEMIVVAPLEQFRKRKIQPFPGLVVEINGNYGRVQSVSGGRVRVDFNSELAGKEVEFRLKVENEIKGTAEKAEALAEKFFPLKEKKAEVKLNGKELEVLLPKGLPKEFDVIKKVFEKFVLENVKEIEKIGFIEGKGNTKIDEKSIKEGGQEDPETGGEQ